MLSRHRAYMRLTSGSLLMRRFVGIGPAVLCGLAVVILTSGCGRPAISDYLDSLEALANADRIDWESLAKRTDPFSEKEFADLFERSLARRESLYDLVDSVPRAEWAADPRYQLAGEAVLAQLTLTAVLQNFRMFHNTTDASTKAVYDKGEAFFEFVRRGFEGRFSSVEGTVADHYSAASPSAELFTIVGVNSPKHDMNVVMHRLKRWAEGRRDQLRSDAPSTVPSAESHTRQSR